MRRVALMSLLLAAAVGFAARAADGPMTGKEVFEHYCTYCHGSGDGPGTMQLARTRGKDRALLTQRTDLKPEYIESVVRHGLKAMPPFAPSDLSEARLKALMGFLAK